MPRTWIGIALALTVVPHALAQPLLPVGNDFQINAYTTDFQRLPAVARIAENDFVVVWQSRAQDGDAYGIFGQRFDRSGVLLGAEFQVNSHTTGDQSRPQVVSLAGGAFVVVWDSTGSPGTDTGNRSVLARRFDSSGTALAGDVQVNEFTTGAQLRPMAAGLPGGGFVVVWESAGSAGTDSSDYSVQGRRFDATGTAVGDELQVNEITTGRQVRPAVTADDSGAFVVVWENDAGTDGDGSSVAGRRFDALGAGLGGEFQVNVYTTGNQQVPRLASTPEGAFFVVWQGQRPNGDGDEIVGRRFAAEGTALGVEFRLNSFTTSEQATPALVREPGGNFLVAWQSTGSVGDDNLGTSVQARLVTAGGNPLDSDFQVNTYTTNYQNTPAVATDGEAGFLVAWSSFENIGLVPEVLAGQLLRDAPAGGAQTRGNPSPLFPLSHPPLKQVALRPRSIPQELPGQDFGQLETNRLAIVDNRSVVGRRVQLLAAELSIAEGIGAGAGETVDIPIILDSGGQSLSSLAFSVNYDEGCLDFDPTDGNFDGLPDAITFSVPVDFDVSAFFDAGDTDSEIDLVIADVPPMAVLSDGTVALVTLEATCVPPLAGQVTAPVVFGGDPAPSFGDDMAQSVAGRTLGGSVEIHPGPRGDCNGDAFVDAADVSATGFELFDADGSFWLDTPGSTFPGSPVGCDANGDTVVDAGDVACAVRRIFSGLCAGEAAAARPRLELPARVPGADGATVTFPLSFVGNGQPITSVAFAIDFDESILSFDPLDSDLDSVPDAVRFVGTGASLQSVTFTPGDTAGELDFLITDLAPAPGTFGDGVLVEIDFEVSGFDGVLVEAVRFAVAPVVSFGDEDGRSVEGDAEEVEMILFADGFEAGNTLAWSNTVP